MPVIGGRYGIAPLHHISDTELHGRQASTAVRRELALTTRLEKTLKREVMVRGRAFIIAISPEGLKVTVKGKRKGQELRWTDLVSGDAALAIALNASVGKFSSERSHQPARADVRPGKGRRKAPAVER